MRVSACVARATDGRYVFPLPFWKRETLKDFMSDRLANGEAFADEQLIRLPRRFSRAHAWPGLRGPGSRGSMPAECVAKHVERSLRYGVPLPSYIPKTIGLSQEVTP